MISMLACACDGKPALGASSSSFQTHSEPQPTRAGSPPPAKEKWCLAFSQPRSSPANSLNGLRSIIGAFLDNPLFSQNIYGHHDELDIETVETHRFTI